MPARRLLNALLIAACLACFTGLTEAVHLESAGSDHDAEHCLICLAWASAAKTVPDFPAEIALERDAGEPAIAPPALTCLVREVTSEPSVPRAPPDLTI